MPVTVKGVIARSKGAPVELVDIVVPDPGPGEAVVQVQGRSSRQTTVGADSDESAPNVRPHS